MTISAGNIREEHHFVKFCKYKQLIRENGVVIGVHPWAFELRKPTANFLQEKSISGVYYEFCDGSAAEKILACYHFISMEIKRKDALIRMGAGLIKAQGEKRSRSLRIRHEPEPDCSPYAAIYGLPVETDDELCALLAIEAVVDIVGVSSIV